MKEKENVLYAYLIGIFLRISLSKHFYNNFSLIFFLIWSKCSIYKFIFLNGQICFF
jgi:hypothetical protein